MYVPSDPQAFYWAGTQKIGSPSLVHTRMFTVYEHGEFEAT